jgi:hypothetical protein
MPNVPVQLPASIVLPLDTERISSENKDDLVGYLTDLVRSLTDALEQISQVVNNSPEYSESDTQPLPADGKFLIWKNSGTGEYKLIYGDGGAGYLL